MKFDLTIVDKLFEDCCTLLVRLDLSWPNQDHLVLLTMIKGHRDYDIVHKMKIFPAMLTYNNFYVGSK